ASCGNAANLFLSRSVSRVHELAVRAALGAGNFRLIRYFLTESIIVALTGGVLGTALASFVLHAFLKTIPPNLMHYSLNPMRLNGRAALCAVVASVLSGIVVGSVPAIRAMRGDIIAGVRRASGAKSYGDKRFRGVIVAVESALALILLIGAGLTSRTVW